ncbi:hypothetical protein A2W14_01730, partial [Candidatus Gottesmanbacteria bacterium RBG_16_37_8]
MLNAVSTIFRNFLYGYLPYLVIFLMSLYMPADTDLGWHLKYGEYFSKTGHFLSENILSLEMPGYRWPNISWLTDYITYSIYHQAGFLGLAIAGALITTLIFFFLERAFRLSFWEKAFIFSLVFYIEEPLLNVSFRGQLLSTLSTAILIYILSRFQQGRKKFIFWALPLFLLWANTHGGFLIGLSILTIFYFLRQFKLFFSKDLKAFKADLIYLPVIVLSFAVTLINPHGMEIYREVIRHFGNPYQKYIVEWVPLPPFSSLWWLLIFWGIFLIFNIRMIIDKKKFSQCFEWIVIAAVFYFLAHWMRRYAWTMYLVSVPVIITYFRSIKPALNSFMGKAIPLMILGGMYLYTVMYHIPKQRLNFMNWDRFCADFIKCSPASAEFLKENKLPGKFLSNYNWGGWLIWNYPEIKPSIDGRMHLWRDEKGYSAFAKYYFLEQNVEDIEKTDYEVVYMSSEKPLYDKMLELVVAGKWKTVY